MSTYPVLRRLPFRDPASSSESESHMTDSNMRNIKKGDSKSMMIFLCWYPLMWIQQC